MSNHVGQVDVESAEHYELLLFSVSGGPVRSSSGVQIWTEAIDIDDAHAIHALMILGGHREPDEIDERIYVWMRQIHLRATAVAGSRGGTRLLAQAGLSAKNAASGDLTMEVALGAPQGTRWLSIRERDERDVLETAVALVQRDLGYGIAHGITSCVMSDLTHIQVRDVFSVREARASELIRASAQHLRMNSENRVSIADAAQAAAMSERNFLRRFKQEIGVTPTEFVLRVRLEKACTMLVQTDLPADKVARRTGLGSGDRLAKLFRRHILMSPTQYRAAARDRLATSASDEHDDCADRAIA